MGSGIDTLRVGYLAVVDPASRIQARPYKGDVVLENRGPAAGIAEGFTWLAHGGENLSGTLNSIRETGFRTNSLFGFPVIEFAIATDAPWELLSQNEINIFIDVDKDGSDDVLLQATDWSTYNGTVGVLLTAQFDLVNGGGFLDWLPNTGDYNDSVVALPFTLAAGGGLVPDSFDYRIEFDARDGSQDVQYGSVDLADEIVRGIALDIEQGKMYWSERGTQPRIWRANLDGTKQEDVVVLPEQHHTTSGQAGRRRRRPLSSR